MNVVEGEGGAEWDFEPGRWLILKGSGGGKYECADVGAAKVEAEGIGWVFEGDDRDSGEPSLLASGGEAGRRELGGEATIVTFFTILFGGVL